jgi:hypothetical protein
MSTRGTILFALKQVKPKIVHVSLTWTRQHTAAGMQRMIKLQDVLLKVMAKKIS